MGKQISGAEDRPLIPARGYLAVIVGVYDIGRQDGEYGVKPQWVIEFELHTRKGPVLDEEGKILKISSFVSGILGSVSRKSALLKIIEAVEGRAFDDNDIKTGYDIENLLERPVRVQVVHKPKPTGGFRSTPDAITALDEDDDAPKIVSDSRYFEIKEGDRSLPDWLPKFVTTAIGKSEEFSSKKAGSHAAANGKPVTVPSDDDDSPF